MSNNISQYKITKLVDGPKHLVVHVYIKSDGVSGETTDLVIADKANGPIVGTGLNGAKEQYYNIENITYAFNGFTGKLSFQKLSSPNNTMIWVLPVGTEGEYDFLPYGGLEDKLLPLDTLGKVLFSTIGFGDLGDEGSFIIKLRKNY